MTTIGLLLITCAAVLSLVVAALRRDGQWRVDSVLFVPSQRVLVATYYLRAAALIAGLCALAMAGVLRAIGGAS